ncbi:MAG: hypothetical protein IJF83_07025 [Methanobrevibacter sp.]|nr:hypothetical protein [Methanobrevibacter sp.]
MTPDYTMFSHNRYNRVSWNGKYHGFKRIGNVFNAPIRLKRTDMFLNIKYKTSNFFNEHHTENSYYYFNDRYAGHRYVFIHGSGILETRTDTYVKKFDDDPILGWHNR